MTIAVIDAGAEFGPYASVSSWYSSVDYLAYTLVVDGEPVELDADEIVVRFGKVGLAVAVSGCDFGGGGFTLDGEVLTVASWEQVAEGCDGERPELWAHLTQLFSSEPVVRTSGVRLQLSAGGLVLQLDPVLVRDPEILRCRGEGTTIRSDITTMYPTTETAIEAAADLAGVGDLAFTQEARSNTWLAGSSDDPQAMIDLGQRDGRSDWLVQAVRVCVEGPAEPPLLIGTSVQGATPLPFRLVVEDARTLIGQDHYETRLVDTSEGFTELWAQLGLVGPPPAIDFGSSVVLYFAALHGSTCPLGSIQGLTYDPRTSLIYPEAPFLDTGGSGFCTTDGIAHAILVAVDRTELPTNDFELSARMPQHR